MMAPSKPSPAREHIRGLIVNLMVIPVLALLTACQSVPNVIETNSPRIKRSSIWVPDLDRAIIFYRDVLGFRLYSEGELSLKRGSVMIDLFNLHPDTKIRRALFSSATEDRILFVMESKNAPVYRETDKRFSALIVQTGDMEKLKIRARNHGFKIGSSNREVSSDTGAGILETVIFGPGGRAALVYEIVEPK